MWYVYGSDHLKYCNFKVGSFPLRITLFSKVIATLVC